MFQPGNRCSTLYSETRFNPAGESDMSPSLTNGKICYLELPVDNVQRSADFYRKIFGWKLRQRGDGH